MLDRKRHVDLMILEMKERELRHTRDLAERLAVHAPKSTARWLAKDRAERLEKEIENLRKET